MKVYVFKLINFTSFGESVFAGEFTLKTIKEGLFINANHIYPQRNRCGKTLEDSRRQTTEAEGRWLPCGAARPPRPTSQPLLRMSVLHRLLDFIYVVFSSRFNPRVQN